LLVTYLRLLLGTVVLAMNKDGDILTLRVEDAVREGQNPSRLDPQTGLLEGLALGALVVGFSKVDVAAREAILPCDTTSAMSGILRLWQGY
jgi:hypothetical protein